MRAIQFNGCEVREIDIENTLEALQAAVNGYIEVVTLVPDYAAMIVNEEGRLHQMKPNIMASIVAGQKIVGPALVVGIDGEEFTSIPTEIARHIKIRCNV